MKQQQKELIDFTIGQIANLLQDHMEDFEDFFAKQPIDYDTKKTNWIEFIDDFLMKKKFYAKED